MNVQDLITEALAMGAGGVITVFAGYYLFGKDIRAYLKIKEDKDSGLDGKKELLHLRLQAHERVILFVERINPSNLFLRLYQQGMVVEELQVLALNELRTEYQHNISQQLYIGTQAWQVVRKLKDDTVAMINNAAKSLDKEASAAVLSKVILSYMGEMEQNPYELSQELLKKDIHHLF
eukprot:gene13312-16229_t